MCLFTDLVAQRGEKLELLIDKTENLVDSVSFKTQFFLLFTLYLCFTAQYFTVKVYNVLVHILCLYILQ